MSGGGGGGLSVPAASLRQIRLMELWLSQVAAGSPAETAGLALVRDSCRPSWSVPAKMQFCKEHRSLTEFKWSACEST